MPESYKLSTVVFADIAGYTAIMQRDEPRALALLGVFKVALEELVAIHEGNIIQFFGDGALLAFESASQAVNCSIVLQQRLRKAEVPVRIGLHLGEVLHRDNNLFGDTVNLASRIESISQPGAVLVSKAVREQLKNKQALALSSLGTFSFKNVQEPMEVFAVQHEDLVIPNRSSIAGKLATNAPEKKRFPWLTIGLAGLLIGLGVWWLMNQKGESHSPILSEELRAKRVAVTVFDNQTGAPELDAYGKLISDWLTNGLMESGSANVINSANISQQLNELGEAQNLNSDVANDMGLDMILRGRYYLLGEELFIQANLVRATNGEVIHSVTPPVSGSRDSLAILLKALSQRVLGYWAVQDFEPFAQDPPNYEAYELFLDAQDYVSADPDRSIDLLHQSFEADSHFFAPLLSLHGLYRSEGNFQRSDEVFEFLSGKTQEFTPWEKLRYQEMKAIREKNWAGVAQLTERRYQMDSSDQQALHMAVISNNYLNQPTHSLELMQSFNPNYLKSDLQEMRWIETNLVFPHYLLGLFDQVDSMARNYSLLNMPDAQAAMHLKSLAFLKKEAELATFFQIYQQKGVYNTSGKPTPFFMIHAMVCDALLLSDQPELLNAYVDQLEAAAGPPDQDPNHFEMMGYVHFFRREYEAAAQAWEASQIIPENWPGWLRFSREMDRISRIGHCYALAQEYDQANSWKQQLIDQLGSSSDFQEVLPYHQARILAGEGKLEQAVASLEEAIQQGYHFYGPVRFREDPFLLPLMNHPDFVALTEPR